MSRGKIFFPFRSEMISNLKEKSGISQPKKITNKQNKEQKSAYKNKIKKIVEK